MYSADNFVSISNLSLFYR